MIAHDWSDFITHCQTEVNSDILYNSFLETVNLAYNAAFPLKTLKISKKQQSSSPWMTKLLIRSCKTKSQLLVTSKKLGTDESRNKFTAYRNKLKKVIKAAEKMYYDQKFLENSSNSKKNLALY